MKEVFLLTKILLKSSMNSSKQVNQKNSLFKYIGWGLIYLYLIGIVGFFSFEIISALKQVNQEAVFLNLCLIVMLGITIMRSLFTTINLLFFSKDIEFLLPLPIKSHKIIMAKLNCLIISEYIMYLIILVPAFIMYGYLLKLGFMFYIMAALIILIFPILPISFISLIITIIMKFTNIIRNKDFVQYITVILTMIFVFAVQFLTTGSEEITTEQLAQKLVETNGLVEIYSKYFITIKPSMNAILDYNNLEGIKNLSILIVESVVSYVLVVTIMSKFYIKTATNITTASSSKKHKDIKKHDIFKKKSIIKSYVKKEFLILFRNPIFFMQCVLPSILFPLIIGIPMYVSINNISPNGIEQISTDIANNLVTPVGIAISVSILIFFYLLNFISITSVSRDGENAVFIKYIPVSLSTQCLYKILPGIIMNIIPAIYLTIVLKLFLIKSIPTVILFTINLIALLFNILLNYFMIIIDLKNPKLHWTTEYAVVKQNMNMIWEMFIYLLAIAMIFLWGFFVRKLSFFVFTTCLLLFILIINTKNYIKKNENKLFEKII